MYARGPTSVKGLTHPLVDAVGTTSVSIKKEEIVNRATSRGVGFVTALSVLTLVAAACSDGAGAASAADLSVAITAPKDHAKVGEPFTVTLDPSVPLGDPSTGEHHVHLCFDGQSCDTQYQLVYSDSAQVEGLTPGEHTIEASLRNADHSDAGASDTITVTVTSAGGGAASSDTPTQPPSPSPTDTRYGY
jgi:hypothetical protein